MPQEAIPFANLQTSGHEELGGAGPVAINVVADGVGTVRQRPGIKAADGITSGPVDPNGISGLYQTNSGLVFAVGAAGAERPIYQVTAGGSAALGGGTPPYGLRGSLRPVFAETELLLVVAGGDLMEKIVLSGPTSDRLGGSPPMASHVIANNTRLLANDLTVDRTKVRFSGTALGDTSYAGHEVWSLSGIGTSGFFTAETRPDDVVALGETTSEVFVFGSGSTQVFTPDPQLTYAPVVTIELGCSAPYSIVEVDGAFFWLDDRRRLVHSNGRSYEVISDAIKRTLDGIATVSDCFGFRVTTGFIDAIVWVFPSDGRTFCYQKGIGWGEWLGWSDTNNTYTAGPVTSAAQRPLTGDTLVGTSAGRIGKFSFDTTTDFGIRVNAHIETGYLNHKTDSKKNCKAVRFAFRRGLSLFGTSQESQDQPLAAPQALFGFRDQPGSWTTIPIDLGDSGDTEIVVEFRSLGVYRRRQWYFEFSDTSDLALVSCTEEFDVLDS